MNESNYQNLVSENVRFAEGVARRFYREHQHELLEYEDIRSAAYIGLCAAASRYQQNRGVNFRAYSYMRIRGAMYDMLRNEISPFSSRRAVEQARVDADETKRTKPKETAFPSLQVAVSRVVEELGISYGGEINQDEPELTYLNGSSPEEASFRRAFGSFIDKQLEKLSEKEREVLTRRYYDDMSFPEIAPYLNDVRTSWLCRIHSRAIDKLRNLVEEQDAQEWLDEVA